MLACGTQQWSCPRLFSWCGRGERLFFLPASCWGFQAAIDGKADLSLIYNWKQRKKPAGRHCPLLNVKWKQGFERMCFVVCLRLKFLMPLLAKFRAVSSPSQKTTNAKKKTWWSGVVESPQMAGQYHLQHPYFGRLNSLAMWHSHTVLSSSWKFFYRYRSSHEVQPCTQSTSTSIKMHYALYGFLLYFL